MKELKVAIVHDYLNQMGGAERVVAVFHKMFPDAPIYTTIIDHDKLMPELKTANIKTTWVQKVPGILKKFKLYFWLYPFAVRSMDLEGYNFILSSSSAYAKGVRKSKGSVHLCYCHTPMRFAWSFNSYMEDMQVPKIVKTIAKLFTYPLRFWDRMNSKGVDRLIANSTVVKERIKQCYGVEAPVIYPPVDVERFAVNGKPAEDFYLVVSRLVSYKKIDLAVEACTRLGKKLYVIGSGPDRKRLEAIAGPTITFLGRKSDQEVTDYMQRCKALFFPGIEDFGITPLEVNACGRPVIAFAEGGALDTVSPEVTGLFFRQQTPEALMAVVETFDSYEWNPQMIREHAEKFNEVLFMERLKSAIEGITQKSETTTTNVIGVEF